MILFQRFPTRLVRDISAVVWLLTVMAGHLAAEEKFVPMFDGKSLNGWTVAPLDHASDWSVEGGVISGRTTERGSYLAWTGGGEWADFEVRLSYRILSKEANTGIHIRSRFVPDAWPYPLQGYQADIGHVGIGAHVLGGWDFLGIPRGDNLVNRGYRVVIDTAGRKTHTPIQGALTVKDIKVRDWNDAQVIARGERMTFLINGKVASEVIDRETSKRALSGMIGLQLHEGGPMAVQFRHLRIRRLTGEAP